MQFLAKSVKFQNAKGELVIPRQNKNDPSSQLIVKLELISHDF